MKNELHYLKIIQNKKNTDRLFIKMPIQNENNENIFET